MFNTPILFLIFNRPDTTQRVFEKIKAVKPRYLFVAADGPRLEKEGEAEKCRAARQLVIENIDWDCELKTLFREENLGCGKAVSQAITWFFEHVEQGIILEDDCLPDLSFFFFCEELLLKYKDEPKIMHIGGHSLGVKHNNDIKYSYFFSAYNHIWGWATWRRAWQHYKLKITIEESAIHKSLHRYFKTKKEIDFWQQQLLNSLNIDTWDYQWTFAIWNQGGISILPRTNLVKNIGFGEEATHTKYTNPIVEVASYGNIKDLEHTDEVSLVPNYTLDMQMSNSIFNIHTAISPLTLTDDVSFLYKIPISKVIQAYKNSLNLDISHYVENITEIKVFQCNKTGYRFYYPFNTAGDGKFYEHLQQYDWYYMPWKWEHKTVKDRISQLGYKLKVLEVGCAKGSFIENLSKEDYDCTGLELNESAACEAQNKGLDVRIESIQEHVPKHENHYDVVCSFQVMEHIPNIGEVTESSVKVLKKGGHLFISVPNNASFLGLDANNPLNMPPHHMGLWDEQSLRNIASVFGLQVKNIYLEPLQDHHKNYFNNIFKQLMIESYEYYKSKHGIIGRLYFKFFKSVIKKRLYAKYPQLENFTIIAEYVKL